MEKAVLTQRSQTQKIDNGFREGREIPEQEP